MKGIEMGESAEALVAFVRDRVADPSGAGEWMGFALAAYDADVRESERARIVDRVRRLPEAEAILTPDETALALAIPKKTVIALCAQGRLPGAFKAGRRWRIPGRAVRSIAGEEVARCR